VPVRQDFTAFTVNSAPARRLSRGRAVAADDVQRFSDVLSKNDVSFKDALSV
jgi:hypothetical protein